MSKLQFTTITNFIKVSWCATNMLNLFDRHSLLVRKEISITEQFDSTICRYGYLSPEQAQPVHREVAALCTELRPQALNLVDAFGIPQPFLGAIACDWVEYNSWQNVL